MKTSEEIQAKIDRLKTISQIVKDGTDEDDAVLLNARRSNWIEALEWLTA